MRDIFMLLSQVKDYEWVKKEVSERVNFNSGFSIIKDKITSAQFKDNLQGVYGFIDKNAFERNKKMLIAMGENDK